ncbi:hypothetical protein A2U01_0076894, partial [Trifolium medium]|nr:hypothetical protein [Trifolium medium]
RRVKTTAGRKKGLSKTSFDFEENPIESNTEMLVDTAAGMNFDAETLGKTDQKIRNNASASVTRPTGVVSDNEVASTRANFESETGNVGVPDNEP